MEETAHPFTPTGLLAVYLSRSEANRRDEPIELVTFLRFTFVGTVGDPIEGRALDDGIVRTLWMSLEELRACRDRHRSPMVMRWRRGPRGREDAGAADGAASRCVGARREPGRAVVRGGMSSSRVVVGLSGGVDSAVSAWLPEAAGTRRRRPCS